MEYKRIKEESLYSLEYSVREKINEGWKPMGGIGVEAGGNGTYGGYKVRYYQVIVKE